MKLPEGMTIVPAPELADAELAQVAHFRIHFDDYWNDFLDAFREVANALEGAGLAFRTLAEQNRLAYKHGYLSRKSYRLLKKKRRLTAHYNRKIARTEQYPTKGWTTK